MSESRKNAAKPANLTAAQKARIIERGAKIFELRKNGASFRQISQALTEKAKVAGNDVRR